MRFLRLGVWGVAVVMAGQLVAQGGGLNPLGLSAHHVTASVADLEKEASWYERVLGFERSKLLGDTAEFKMYQMTMPGYRIDLVWQKGSVRQRGVQGAAVQGWLHTVFQTKDLDGAYRYLLAKGTDVKAVRDGQGKVVHLNLHDAEGNEIGIAGE